MPANPATILSDFVAEKIPGEPLLRQAELYRALADFASPEKRAALLAQADHCDDLIVAHAQHEVRHAQLRLNLKAGTRNGGAS